MYMALWRAIKPECIKLDLEVAWPCDSEGSPLTREKALWIIKEEVLRLLVDLHEKSGKVVNKKRLFTDLLNREKKATTAIGNGIAIPHVRTMQVNDVSFCFAKSEAGIEFDAIDGEPCHLFFSIVGPPYDDQMYLRYFKKIASILQYEAVRKAFLEAKTPDEVIKIIRDNEQ